MKEFLFFNLFLHISISCIFWAKRIGCDNYNIDLNVTLDTPQFAVIQDAAELALQYVENIQTATTCDGGTGSILNVLFDNSAWKPQANAAIRLSNLLTKNWQIANGTGGDLNDALLFAMTRTTIELEALAFGCAIAFEPLFYRNMSKFCAYSFHTGNETIKSHDISVEYDYFPSEWYLGAKLKFNNLTNAAGKASNVTEKLSEYDFNGTKIHKTATNFIEPKMEYEDGFWTRPYFDCGGGNIWMITFNSPIMTIIDGSWIFAGVATVDVALNILDIDQCDPTEEKKVVALNVFRGTHHCKPTTTCSTRSGFGFRRGTYYCFCRSGFYFPNSSASVQAFTGFDVETAYADWMQTGSQDYLSKFDCLPCPEGCETCIDSTPCMAEYNWTYRSLLVALVGLIFLAICILLATVIKSRKHPVMGSVGVVFFIIICLGGLMATFTDLALFFKPSVVSCTIRIWFQHMAFILVYGPILLRIWRVIATYNAAKKLKKGHIVRDYRDETLLKKLGLMLTSVVSYLAIWTTLKIPEPQLVKTEEGQKFYTCHENWVDYTIFIAEFVFLLWGVFICYKVRSVPTVTDEFKLIAWSVYNTTVMRNVLLLLRIFMIGWIGPDVLYLIYVLELQIPVVFPFMFIFGPKMHILYTTVVLPSNSATAEKEITRSTNQETKNAGFLFRLELSVSGSD